MFDLNTFYDQQCQHCKDLLQEAERERLKLQALAHRQQFTDLPELARRIAGLMHKNQPPNRSQDR